MDFLNKKRVKNKGIVPQYYVENSHEAIIPRDIFMRVQEEMVRRANLHSGEKRKKRVYSSKYALSSIVCYSKCGDIYRRIAWNNRGKHFTVWRCCTRVDFGPSKCDAPTIGEAEPQDAAVKAINKALGGREDMMKGLQENIKKILSEGSDTAVQEIDNRLLELQKELLKKVNARRNYDDLADEIEALREQKHAVMVESAEREGVKKRVAEMQQFLAEQKSEITEYDESLVRQLIEKITVYEDQFEVMFKSQTTVEIKRIF